MSSSVNYKDLYEEFLSLTSSPRSSNDVDLQSDSHQLTPIKAKQPDTPVNSPLRALTPPSPISTTYSIPATTFLSLKLGSYTEQDVGMSSNDYKMCDSSEVSNTRNVTVSSSGSEKQSPTETNNQSNGQSSYFQNLPIPSAVSSTGAGMQGGLQHGLPTIQNQSNMIVDVHQQHHIPIHHQVNHYSNQHLQHQTHPMLSMNQHQGNVHQFSHLPHSHLSHSNIHSMPFGMTFNSVSGNGAPYINNQMDMYHQQLGGQQQAHPQTMQQQANCFMQHSCMHMQNQSLIAALNAPRSSSSTVGGWMSAQPSSVPVSNSVANTCPILSSALASFTSGCKAAAVAKVAVPNILHTPFEDPTTLPGGLEHLWKKMPVECQKLMTPQDIPESARHRGYFTVCELLKLKRALMMRSGTGTVPLRTAAVKNSKPAKKEKEECKRGSKKGRTNTSNTNRQVTTNSESSEGYESGQRFANEQQHEKTTLQPCEQKGEENGSGNMEHDLEVSTFGEQMIAIANIKNEEIVMHTDMPPITGICVAGAVKDAMNALTSDENNASAEEETASENDNVEEQHGQDEEISNHTMNNNSESLESNGLSRNDTSHSEAGITGEELAMLPPLPPISEILPKKSTPMDLTSTNTELNADTEVITEEERQKQLQLSILPITSMSTSLSYTGTSSAAHSSGTPVICCGSSENRSSVASTAAPPFRTSTLVLKLLQIGSYCIRSFSSINPNRFRVLFNTHRITYECQLPIIQPAVANPGLQLMRKVLTVDIGFDQIRMLRFGADNLFMRVEGAPLLTISYCPALEESNIQVLTYADEVLLDQIEQGQLKLSPCHQLYFLNERLVQQLELQFREHPRFRHLLFEDAYGNQALAHKRMRMS